MDLCTTEMSLTSACLTLLSLKGSFQKELVLLLLLEWPTVFPILCSLAPRFCILGKQE